MKLKGRNIILTGASRGFGAYLFDVLLKEGANVFAVARTIDEINVVRAEGNVAKCMKIDLEEDSAEDYVVVEASKFFDGRIDGLVNNAAMLGPIGAAWNNDWDDWLTTQAVNLWAPVRLCQLVVPFMIGQGSGSIVNLSGGGAARPRPEYSAYATSKAGLVRFSETLAMELGPFARVNCVAPGAMPTDMNPDVLGSDELMRRPAELIVFLLSDESHYITGRLISAVWDKWDHPNTLEKLRDPDYKDLFTLRRVDDEG